MLELEIKSLREAVETLSSNLEALVRATAVTTPVEDKPVEDKPKKRKRRTKAEIEAEKKAEIEDEPDDLEADEPKAVEDESVTLTDLQDLVMGKVRSDRSKKPEIVKILEGFGVKNISSLDEKHFPEVKAAIEKL